MRAAAIVEVEISTKSGEVQTYVNAHMAARTLRDLGGSHFYESVSSTNTPSRRMVESCGLRQSSELFSAVAVSGQDKFSS